jgi:hypothetical protein
VGRKKDATNDFYKKETCCKACVKVRNHTYYLGRKGELNARSAQYVQENAESIKNYQSQYWENNSEQLKKRKRKYAQEHRAERAARDRDRMKSDPAFRLRQFVSVRIRQMLKSQFSKKNNSFLKHVPYTMEQLKEHLEKQFEPWMNWDNQGSYRLKTWDDNDPTTWTWQLDHIIPRASLPYSSMDDKNFHKCWALENLRLLSAKQNHSDGMKRTRHIK